MRHSPAPGPGAAGRPGRCTAWADTARSAWSGFPLRRGRNKTGRPRSTPLAPLQVGRPPLLPGGTGLGFIARSRDALEPVGCRAGRRRGDRLGGEWNEPRGCHGNWPWVPLSLGRGPGACVCLCVATGFSRSAGRGRVESRGRDPGLARARGKETPVSSWKPLGLPPGPRHRHSPPRCEPALPGRAANVGLASRGACSLGPSAGGWRAAQRVSHKGSTCKFVTL